MTSDELRERIKAIDEMAAQRRRMDKETKQRRDRLEMALWIVEAVEEAK